MGFLSFSQVGALLTCNRNLLRRVFKLFYVFVKYFILSIIFLLILTAPIAIISGLLSKDASFKSLYSKAFSIKNETLDMIADRLNSSGCKTPLGLSFGVSPSICWIDILVSFYFTLVFVPLVFFLSDLLAYLKDLGAEEGRPIRRKGIRALGWISFVVFIILEIFLLISGKFIEAIFVFSFTGIIVNRVWRGSKATSLALITSLFLYLYSLLHRMSVLGGFAGASINDCIAHLQNLPVFIHCLYNYRTENQFWLLVHVEAIMGMSYILTAFPLLALFRYFSGSPKSALYVIRGLSDFLHIKGERDGGRAGIGNNVDERGRKGRLLYLSRAFIGLIRLAREFLDFWGLIYRQVIIRARGYVLIPFAIGVLLTLFLIILPFFRQWLVSSPLCIGVNDISDLYQDVDVITGSFLLWGLPMAGFVLYPEEIIHTSVGPTLRRILIKSGRKIVILGSGRLAKSLLHAMRDRYEFENVIKVMFEDRLLKVHQHLVLIDYDEFVAHKVYEDEVFGKIGVYIMEDSAIICLLGERESTSPDFKLKDSKEKLHLLNRFTDYFEVIVIASRSPRVQNGIFKMIRDGRYFRGKYGVLIMSLEQNSQMRVLFPSYYYSSGSGEDRYE